MRRFALLLILVYCISIITPSLQVGGNDCNKRTIIVNLHRCNAYSDALIGLNRARANDSSEMSRRSESVLSDMQHAAVTRAPLDASVDIYQSRAISATSVKRVLFLGNSYTSANNLPAIFGSIVRNSGKHVPSITAVTPGGISFRGHVYFPATIAAIDAGNWDVVVLQDQSQEPAFAEIDLLQRAEMVQSAAALCQRIRRTSPHARIIFYETWARKANYWVNNIPQLEGANATEMQARLRKWYGFVARANNATVAPVGDAWEYNYRKLHPTRLHTNDNSHPKYSGSYLAGLVIFGKIYGNTIQSITWNGTLKANIAQQMRAIAAHTLGTAPSKARTPVWE